jgi:hypothetical protein
MASESAVPNTVSLENADTEKNALAQGDALANVPAARRRRRVLYFDFADRWFNRFVKVVEAVHEGFWLGCLSVDDLDAITAEYYRQSHEYASEQHNLRGFFDWEGPVVHRYFKAGSHILVAGAGGGREVIALRRAGFQAEGFECNAALLRASEALFQQLGEPQGVIFCAPDSVPPGPPIYDGLIVGWSAYTHIPTRRRRVAFLQGMRQRTLLGSPVLLSFFTRETVSPYEEIAYRTACLCRFLSRGRKETPELGDHLTWSYTHHFVRAELEEELSASGFRLVHFNERGDSYAVGIAE